MPTLSSGLTHRSTCLKVPQIPDKVSAPTKSCTLGEKRPVSCVSPDVEDQSSADEGRKFKAPYIPARENAKAAQEVNRPPASSVVDDVMSGLMERAIRNCTALELYNVYKGYPKSEMSKWPVYCLHRSGELGFPQAQLELAKIYYVASTSEDLDPHVKYWKRKKFWEWLVAAAKNGVPQAQHKLGINLLKMGRVKDAAKWFEKAAKQNYPNQEDELQHLQQVALTLLSLGGSNRLSPSPPLTDRDSHSEKLNT